MYSLYSILVSLTWQFLKLASIFKPKLRLFVRGRQDVFPTLKDGIGDNEQVIWVHTASLGEFEQGLPVIKALKKTYPRYKVLVTFFSPSGFEVKKNSAEADLITYLPLDTLGNAKRFLNQTRPALALFVKYEIWPNYMKELSRRGIPTVLISGRFTKNQVFFSWYGGFMRNALRRFSHYFVQDEQSQELLKSIGIDSISISGDTRFDRVNEILLRDNSLEFMERFKGEDLCFVLGSTWPEDEALLRHYLQAAPARLKIVVAPHDIKEEHLSTLRELIPGKAVFYSELETQDPSQFQVLILDTIGLLTKVYSYADLAYVGGGFATGLHNTLEPAVFGIPVITGPDFQGFREAEDLVNSGGISVVNSAQSFSECVEELVRSEGARQEQGEINSRYVSLKKGATEKIMNFIIEEVDL